jgi:fatty-acyl-CoA synthase
VVSTGGEKVFVEKSRKLRAPGYCRCVGHPAARANGGRRGCCLTSRETEPTRQTNCCTPIAHRIGAVRAPKEFIVVEQVRRLGNGKADYR